MGKKISIIITAYFVIGIVFAFLYALFYHWTPLSYFSPGFYIVILTWPFQVAGFVNDLLIYGPSGKLN